MRQLRVDDRGISLRARVNQLGGLALAAAILLLGSPHVSHGRQAGGPDRLRLQWNAGIHTIYDTNLERRHDGPASFGVIASAGTGLRANVGRSALTADYEYALHRYELSEQFNRSAHTARTSLVTRPARSLLLAATAEYAVGSTSEDREIGSQYSLLPRVELRPDPRHRLRLQSGYRLRRFGDLSGNNSDNYLASLDYRLGESRRPTVEFGSRIDVNATSDPRSRFERWTHRVRFNAPIASSAELSFGLQQSTRLYPDRLLHMEAGEDLSSGGLAWLERYREAERGRSLPGSVLMDPEMSSQRYPRRDEIWMPTLGLSWQTRGGFELELGYQFEARVSNDLRKGYGGHATALSTRIQH